MRQGGTTDQQMTIPSLLFPLFLAECAYPFETLNEQVHVWGGGCFDRAVRRRSALVGGGGVESFLLWEVQAFVGVVGPHMPDFMTWSWWWWGGYRSFFCCRGRG